MTLNITKRNSLHFILLILVFGLTGCAGTVKNMKVVSADNISSTPDKGKSLIVFMRPSSLGFAVQSSVFQIEGNKLKLAGIVAAKKKVAYQVDPGEHIFMVVGESADFMYAHVEENKTYYALVTPRMGLWKARFSLKPVHSEEFETADFNEWKTTGEWVELTQESESWAASNMNSLKTKQTEYFQDWMEKPISDRPKLYPQDGS